MLIWDKKAYALSKSDISKIAEDITVQIDGSVQGSGVLIKKDNACKDFKKAIRNGFKFNENLKITNRIYNYKKCNI